MNLSKNIKIIIISLLSLSLIGLSITNSVFAEEVPSSLNPNSPHIDITEVGELVIQQRIVAGDMVKLVVLNEDIGNPIMIQYPGGRKDIYRTTTPNVVTEVTLKYFGENRDEMTITTYGSGQTKRLLYAVYVNDVKIFGESDIITSAEDETIAKSGIQGSGFEVIAPSLVDFGVANISKTTQVIDKTLGTVNVSDYTGLGNGWRLLVSATNFTDGVNSLPNNSLLLNVPDSVSVAGDTVSVLPNVLIESPVFIDNGNTVTLANANIDEGMGSFDINFVEGQGLTAKIPPSTKIGNYESVITWQIVTGP